MPAYDQTWFQPPAPLARVTLRNPANGATWSDVPMLLDSGADITLVPQAAVDVLGLRIDSDERYELVGYDGNASSAAPIQLELIFCHRTFRGQFLVIDQAWGIIGRNIMNAVSLLFDGPHLQWEEQRLIKTQS